MAGEQGIVVMIPAPLRRYTNGEQKVTGSGSNILEVLDGLEVEYPGIRERIVEDDGEIRRFVNVFVNGKNVRKLDGCATPVADGDEVGIIPAMAGGAGQ